jgi:hypothetical protein
MRRCGRHTAQSLLQHASGSLFVFQILRRVCLFHLFAAVALRGAAFLRTLRLADGGARTANCREPWTLDRGNSRRAAGLQDGKIPHRLRCFSFSCSVLKQISSLRFCSGQRPLSSRRPQRASGGWEVGFYRCAVTGQCAALCCLLFLQVCFAIAIVATAMPQWGWEVGPSAARYVTCCN